MAPSAARLPGLASAGAVIFGALAAAARPAPSRTVAQWAEEERYVAAESGSSRPGKWLNATSPFALEPMACLDADHPARWVVVMAAAQMLKSELFMNWAGQTICDDPAPMMLVLPSIDELRNWNNTKWQPTLDATPALQRRVLDVVERSRTGSTTAFKKFRGGFLVVTTAQSSKGLQGRSIKRLACDEVSEFPADAGGRGDPVRQAERRGDAHDDFKGLATSTPKERPGCRITRMYEAGDQRRYYVACPHCAARQVLTLEAMRAPAGPEGRVTFACLACDQPIDEIHKPAMVAGGVWIKTYVDTDPDAPTPTENPDNPAPPTVFPAAELARWRVRGSAGRDPSFHIWQAYSLLKGWTAIRADHDAARRDVQTGRDPEALKVFSQQVLGLAWDAATEAPNHEKLFAARGRYVRKGVVPGWACQVVGAADLQGDRIEWDAYAMGPDLSMARFDWGRIDVDPLEAEAWAQLGAVVGQRFAGEATVDLGFDAFGIDLRGKKGVTANVYRFVRARHNVYAVMGGRDPDLLPFVPGKRRWIRLKDGDRVSIQPNQVGAWGLKTAIYAALELSLRADAERLPGGLYNPAEATHEDFKQYVAEAFHRPKSQRVGARGWWAQIGGQANERLDLAVYSRALFWYLGCYRRTAAEWQTLFEARAQTPAAVLPLFADRPAPVEIPSAETAANPGAERKSLFSGRTRL